MLPATGTASFDEKKRGPKTMRNCVYARSAPTPRSRFIERHTTGGVTFNMEMRKRERLNDTYLKGTLGKDQPTSRLQNRLRFILFSTNNECRMRTSFFGHGNRDLSVRRDVLDPFPLTRCALVFSSFPEAKCIFARAPTVQKITVHLVFQQKLNACKLITKERRAQLR